MTMKTLSPIIPMESTHQQTDPITVIIAIIATLITVLIRNITNNKDLWSTSTPTHVTSHTEDQKKEAGGTTAAPRSSRSSSRTKTTTTGSKNTTQTKAGKNSKNSARKQPTRTPKVAAPNQSTTEPEATLSSQDQISQWDTSWQTISSPASKITTLNPTPNKDQPIAS